MPARRASRMATAASSRGGSIMPTVPTNTRSCSSASPSAWSSPGRQWPVGHGQRAQCSVAEGIDVGQQPRPQGIVQRDDLHAHARPRAAAQQHVGRALCDRHEHVAVFVVAFDRRHQLALRRERDLCDALEAPLAPFRHAQLAFGHQERGFGRVAVDLPLAALGLAQIGVAGQAATAEHDDGFFAQRPGGQLSTARARPDLAARTRPR